MRQAKFGLIVALVGASVALSSSCGGGIGGLGGGGGLSAQCSGDFGASASARKLNAFVDATNTFVDAANDIAGSLTNACKDMGHELGLSDADMAASGDTPEVKAACDAVTAKIRSEVQDLRASASLTISVVAEPPVCEVSMSASADCYASCEVDVDPGEVSMQCDGGEYPRRLQRRMPRQLLGRRQRVVLRQVRRHLLGRLHRNVPGNVRRHLLGDRRGRSVQRTLQRRVPGNVLGGLPGLVLRLLRRRSERFVRRRVPRRVLGRVHRAALHGRGQAAERERGLPGFVPGEARGDRGVPPGPRRGQHQRQRRRERLGPRRPASCRARGGAPRHHRAQGQARAPRRGGSGDGGHRLAPSGRGRGPRPERRAVRRRRSGRSSGGDGERQRQRRGLGLGEHVGGLILE